MRFKRTIKTLTLATVLALSALPTVAQDIIAFQAPVDRKMKAVDTVALRGIMEREMNSNPSGKLYSEWSNKYAHRATELPDSFRIDLRNFCMPTTSRVITSNFGRRWGRMHKGIDVKVYIGDTIRAAFSGKVRVVRYEANGYGNYVVIRHNNGLETIYGHMSKQLVQENQSVRAGDPIGLGGNTGRSTGSHLHFETRLCGVALNPALMFDFLNQDVTDDYYVYRKSSYDRESDVASRVRGNRSAQSESAYEGNSYTAAQQEPYEQQSQRQPSMSGDVRYHKVATGETLYSIARKRGVSIERLCRLNHIGKNMRVKVGQILRYS
ncbi:MAG: M23 family metallopeptidase [Prevotella sp.]|uniref:M23 family metallopeptidase n=1 Tax=Prevotella sp. TaxID=59823 RepID=UPI002A318828|nr:M23 family metallopeptidase [Prevotella sp.]MDD7317722.1 M23 family metallopeptidase [Prevotellaceae bacterium]MDY4020637.1 M23 family metallopeptidase [Prevotella sp.]